MVATGRTKGGRPMKMNYERNDLTFEEECELVRRWREDGDEKAKHKLVLSHMPLVHKMAGIYFCHHRSSSKILTVDDLVQEGALGLMRAMETFDPSKKFRFTTYARSWVILFFQRCDIEKSRGPVLTSHTYCHLKFTGVPWDEVEDILYNQNASPEECVDKKQTMAIVRELMERLSPRERKVLELRFGLDDDEPLTHESISRFFNLSRAGTQNVINAALKKLQLLFQAQQCPQVAA